jgi:hypothetical protein
VKAFDLGDSVSRDWKAGQKNLPVSSVAGIVNKSHARPGRSLSRIAVPKIQRARRDQDDAAERPAIPGHLFQARRYRQSLQRSLRTLVGDRRHHEKRSRELSSQGVAYIQIDAPRYSYYMDPNGANGSKTEMGVVTRRCSRRSRESHNACFQAARRPGVSLANPFSAAATIAATGTPKGGYDAIAEKLFAPSMSIVSCSNTTTSAPAPSSRFRFVPKAKR